MVNLVFYTKGIKKGLSNLLWDRSDIRNCNGFYFFYIHTFCHLIWIFLESSPLSQFSGQNWHSWTWNKFLYILFCVFPTDNIAKYKLFIISKWVNIQSITFHIHLKFGPQKIRWLLRNLIFSQSWNWTLQDSQSCFDLIWKY